MQFYLERKEICFSGSYITYLEFSMWKEMKKYQVTIIKQNKQPRKNILLSEIYILSSKTLLPITTTDVLF